MISKYVDDAALAKLGPGRRAMMVVVFCLLAFCFPATAEGDTAEDLIGMGLELYQNRSYQEALRPTMRPSSYPRTIPGRGWARARSLARWEITTSHFGSPERHQDISRRSEAWFGVGLNRFLLHDQRFPEGLGEGPGDGRKLHQGVGAEKHSPSPYGQNDEALEASKRARMSFRSIRYGDALSFLGSESFILRQMGRDDEFLAALENATTLDPRNYDAGSSSARPSRGGASTIGPLRPRQPPIQHSSDQSPVLGPGPHRQGERPY